MKKQVLFADLGLLVLAVIWGAGFVAGKFALESVTPFYQMSYRYLGAALILFFFSARYLPKTDKKTLLLSSSIGLCMFLGNALQTIGLQYTTPAMQSFIVASYTVIVPFISWVLLKEKPAKQTILAAFMAMTGIAILTLNKNFSMGFGDLLTLGFAFIFSVQVVFTGIFVKKLNVMVYTFVSLLTSGILSLACAALFETPIPFAAISHRSLMAILYLAVLNTALAFLIQNLAQRFAPATHTALIMSLETVFGAIFAVLLVGETFPAKKILGCIIMFLAIIVAKLPFPSRKKC